MLINILPPREKADDTRLPFIVFAVPEFFAWDNRGRRDSPRAYWFLAVPLSFLAMGQTGQRS